MNDGIDRNLLSIVIGLVLLTGVASIAVLAYQGKAIPDSLLGITTTALGALAGALLPRSTGNG